MTKQKIPIKAQAFELGKTAFKDTKRYPRADKNLHTLIDDTMKRGSPPNGIYSDIYREWLRGWDWANLNNRMEANEVQERSGVTMYR